MNFVDAHNFSVGFMVRILGIPASTYYDWRKSRRAQGDAELLRLIDEIGGEHASAGAYGPRRMWLGLRRRSVRVGRKPVDGIMHMPAARAPTCARAGSKAR